MNYNPTNLDFSKLKNMRIDSRGYIRVEPPKDYPKKRIPCYYHRLVMEKHLGRVLEGHEEVHHDDADKLNNNISNLILCKDKTEHSKYEMITRQKLKEKGVKFVYTMSEAALEARKKGAKVGGRKSYIDYSSCDPEWIKKEYLEKKRSFRSIGEELKWHKNKVKKYLVLLRVELRDGKQQRTLFCQSLKKIIIYSLTIYISFRYIVFSQGIV